MSLLVYAALGMLAMFVYGGFAMLVARACGLGESIAEAE